MKTMRWLLILSTGLALATRLAAQIAPPYMPPGNSEPDRGMKPTAATISAADERVALVIGNGTYADGPLRNPPNDAAAITAELRTCGFRVTKLVNADKKQMVEAISNFGNTIRSGQGVGLFYFAGHGVQVNGENYLMPIDANVTIESDVETEGVDLRRVLGRMEEAHNKLNIVVLDACRNNPYARSFRNPAQGLAATTPPSGTLLAYATSAGSVAADGTGNNVLYTQELIRALRTPGLELSRIFKTVRAQVVKRSNGRQTPGEYDQTIGDFYFRAEGQQVRAALPDSAYTLQAFADTAATASQSDLKILIANGDAAMQPQYYAEAAVWYKRAATLGSTEAMRKLGDMYYNGVGGAASNQEAARWYEMAGKKGDATSQYKMGVMYQNGYGVPKNIQNATMWFYNAALKGNADAQNIMGDRYRSGEVVERNYAKALEFYQQAADQGHGQAMLNISIVYINGLGVKKDYTKALLWITKAADQKYLPAFIAMAGMYEKGFGVPKDDSQVVVWLEKAALAGDARSQLLLARRYGSGQGIQQDLKKAEEWYRKAAEKLPAAREELNGLLNITGQAK